MTFPSRFGPGCLALVLLALCAFLVSIPEAAAQETKEAEEARALAELEALQVEVAAKVDAYRNADPAERETMSLQSELLRLGDYVARWQDRQPDLAFGARIFLARQVLWDGLRRERDAEQLLTLIIQQAGNPLIAGMAAMHAAEILVECGAPSARIAAIRKLYEKHPEPDPILLDALRTQELYSKLRPGAELPAISGPGVDGGEVGSLAHRGHICLVLLFNCSHPPSRDAFRAVTQLQSDLGQRGLRTLTISLDADAKVLRAELDRLDERPAGLDVLFDGKGWQSPLSTELGVSSLPAVFVLDRKGRILHRDVPVRELRPLVLDALATDPPADDGGGDGEQTPN